MKVENVKRTLLFSLAASFLLSQANARETVTISSNGKNMFDLVFLDRGESNGNSGASTGTLSRDQKRVVQTAAQYWADILAPGAKNDYASLINVVADGTGYDAGTASFYTTWFKSDPTASAIGDALINNAFNGLSLAEINRQLGTRYATWQEFLRANPRYVGQFPQSTIGGTMHMGTQVESDISLIDEPSMVSKRDVLGTTIHEIGHGLGVSLEIMANANGGNNIYDKYGNNYRTDKSAVRRNVGYFMDSGVTFQGAKTLDVLGSYRYVTTDGINMRGIPLNGYEGGTSPIEGSHFELDNSLQSHQNWRNWVHFMEAEMAVLVDIGYDIDLKRFYGYSVYGSNQNLVNNNPFFARANNAYLQNTANTETYGIGLHIYGKNNNITQAANLLADGKASTGVRIDGSDNIFTQRAGTKITGNGINGMGIWTAFGKEHTLNINGEIEATGKNGIGIRVDFGDNTLGNDAEVRGSHFRWIKYSNGTYAADLYNSKSNPTKNGTYSGLKYDNRTPEMDLDGALISNLNINGKVSGNKENGAAVYIAKNAHVENINIGNGAQIVGDIKSDWVANLEWIYDFNKNVYAGLFNNWTTYGSKAADMARANLDFRTTLGTAANVRNASIDGDIIGNKSIDVVNNGQLSLTGLIDTLSFTNNATGTLSANKGILAENRTGYNFINRGTLNADLVTKNSTINYTNSGNMSGKIVASGKNTFTTSNLGNIGGMDLSANSITNNSIANAVLKLTNVSSVNLANQDLTLSGSGYGLTNSAGNLNILLSDTKINGNTITGKLSNALQISNNNAVYGNLQGNNGVISVTGAITANTISDYNTLKLNFGTINKDNAVLSISQGNVALGGKNLVIGSTDRDILTQAYTKYKLLQTLNGSISGLNNLASLSVQGTWVDRTLNLNTGALNKIELANNNRLLQTVGIGGNNPVVPDPDPDPDPVIPGGGDEPGTGGNTPGCYYHNGAIVCGNDPQPQPDPEPDPDPDPQPQPDPDPKPDPEPDPQPEPTKPIVSPMYDYLMTLLYGPDWWKNGKNGYSARSGELFQDDQANQNNVQEANNAQQENGATESQSKSVKLNKNSEILPAASLGAVAMMNSNTDFIASSALNSSFSYGDGLSGVIGVHAGDLEHEVGSSIEVKNYGAILGVAQDFGTFTFMPFVDVGSGKSETKDMGDTDSKAKYKHMAIGILGRLGADSGFYTDASVRVGRNKTDFEGRVNDQMVEFDKTATYFAGHIGAGYLMPISDSTKVDFFAKYYLSHLNSQSVDLTNKTTGEVQKLDLDSVTSHVSKIGAALKFNASDDLRLSAGAAWQKVYSGKAKGSIDLGAGYVGEAVTPNLKGDSAVIDLGLKYKVSSNLDLGLDATGMFGDSKGGAVKGSFIFKF